MPAKPATRPAYRCSECGQTAPQWVGRCSECQAWGTVAEVGAPSARAVRAGPVTTPARPIGHVDLTTARARPTGVDELDRVLGGGLVNGAVVLLAGEPGVGKSTLLLEVAQQWCSTGGRALYLSGEESAAQVRMRAERTGALSDTLYLAAETDLAAALGHLDDVQPDLLLVDSVQTLAHPDVDGAPGGVSQVRECAAALIRAAKQRDLPTVLVGHVTKDGSIAGPRVLEHLVDVVLHFEGDRHSSLRLVRAVKNRFGPADEVGCFELTDSGIVGVPDPSELFRSHTPEPVPGTAVTVTVEGRRALVVEVQALVAPGAAANIPPRRGTTGLDVGRTAMLLAVVDRRGGISLSGQDVFAATVGGVRLVEPAADLAVALAVASAARDRALPAGLVAIGEVGLAGDVRRVGLLRRRLVEAARLGCTTALVPPGCGPHDADLRVIEVPDLRTALNTAGLLSR